MSDRDAYDRVYVFFHEDGPIRLSEHDLCNDYMRLRRIEDTLAQSPCSCMSMPDGSGFEPCLRCQVLGLVER